MSTQGKAHHAFPTNVIVKKKRERRKDEDGRNLREVDEQ